DEWTEEEWDQWNRREKQKQSAEMPTGSAPSTDGIVSHLSWRVCLKNSAMSVEPGRLFFSEIPKGIDPRIKDMLQPIFSHINR
ncbi:unnamed protein product, partial [Polarella glacialis]